MHLTILTALSTVFVVINAESTLLPYKPAGPEDSRSPCPMLNILANHGYLPHDGRNITLDQIVQAVDVALNADKDFALRPGGIFVQATGMKNFDLEDLREPGAVEHVASLSRGDITTLEDDFAVSHDRVTALLDDSPTNYITPESMAKTRLRVEKLSKPARLSVVQSLTAYIEVGFVIMMLNEKPIPSVWSFPPSDTWAARKDWARVWFVEERFPDELGWKRSETRLHMLDLLPIIKAVWDKKRVLSDEPAWWREYVPAFLNAREEL
ncbi:Chloroperoxidase [Cladobotryum mycophilum]|uniref:Chloroperoxidase n=1 Tax=Cladobotryum mycophilum TaxID=491253 RepID=A0ABR0SIJ6_9HYPO